eukprot:9439567-Karenia_brevis.AAC.1
MLPKPPGLGTVISAPTERPMASEHALKMEATAIHFLDADKEQVMELMEEVGLASMPQSLYLALDNSLVVAQQPTI